MDSSAARPSCGDPACWVDRLLLRLGDLSLMGGRVDCCFLSKLRLALRLVRATLSGESLVLGSSMSTTNSLGGGLGLFRVDLALLGGFRFNCFFPFRGVPLLASPPAFLLLLLLFRLGGIVLRWNWETKMHRMLGNRQTGRENRRQFINRIWA